ncbi:putative quinol monooxygenase [Ktedonobacter racemifer]|uniref:Tetracenomycin polyketide synthesis hydroxylase TcmH n=1 Tax=Ktedonobacter racemifer DSM 44963 TaxID=485913 RepID=D6TQE8_KTERA|nr:antibiotic biosynthesis monooxygenase [Ktedonobacter racemifer]EFH85796.1 tetracenomycin polyketide synthesis hydroxylase TcmH [Ktedonobacter racemifer DSM 44963]
MGTISQDNDVVTTINTFTFEPENQQRGLELLIEIARMLRMEVPGFVSANFHASVDGTRVVNYAQYSSHEALQVATAKVFEKADTPLLVELRQIATPDSREYKVRAILEG